MPQVAPLQEGPESVTVAPALRASLAMLTAKTWVPDVTTVADGGTVFRVITVAAWTLIVAEPPMVVWARALSQRNDARSGRRSDDNRTNVLLYVKEDS